MRKLLLSLAAAAIVSIASLASFAPAAQAMTPSTAAGVIGALEENKVAEDVRYVCRHRWNSSRRVCFWAPNRVYRPVYRPYRPMYRPHRAYRHRHWR